MTERFLTLGTSGHIAIILQCAVDDPTLIWIHRLECHRLSGTANLIGDVSCKITKGCLSSGTIILGIELYADVILLVLLIDDERGQILQRIECLSTLTDQDTHVRAFHIEEKLIIGMIEGCADVDVHVHPLHKRRDELFGLLLCCRCFLCGNRLDLVYLMLRLRGIQDGHVLYLVTTTRIALTGNTVITTLTTISPIITLIAITSRTTLTALTTLRTCRAICIRSVLGLRALILRICYILRLLLCRRCDRLFRKRLLRSGWRRLLFYGLPARDIMNLLLETLELGLLRSRLYGSLDDPWLRTDTEKTRLTLDEDRVIQAIRCDPKLNQGLGDGFILGFG